MKQRLFVFVLALCLGSFGLFAQAAAPAAGPAPAEQRAAQPGSPSADQAAAGSEDEFFGSADVQAKAGAAEKQNVADVVEKEHVGLSGQLQAMSTYNVSRTVVEGTGNLSDNSLSSIVGGDFLVDIRLQKGFKAFLDLNVGFVPGGTPVQHTFTQVFPPGSLVVFENQETALLIKEVFVDFNIANTAYFRAGKQVLKWGTGYFWNPTDLINIEHRSFTNTSALLQGVFGLRSDVVFSPAWHLYTFLNLNGVNSGATDAAFAARSEFLVGSTEFGVSSWLKYGKPVVFGADLSTPLFWSLNLTSEASFSWGDVQPKFDALRGPYDVRDQPVVKIDVGLSRTFDAFDIQDRVSANVEFFYNNVGYSQNMLLLPGFLPLPSVSPGYYQPNFYGQYYAAAFVTIGSFGLNNMSLTLSGLANLSDQSGTALTGLSYAPVNNFTLSLQLGANLGASNLEYTISGTQFFGILTATVAF
jgi:hypothetical protein